MLPFNLVPCTTDFYGSLIFVDTKVKPMTYAGLELLFFSCVSTGADVCGRSCVCGTYVHVCTNVRRLKSDIRIFPPLPVTLFFKTGSLYQVQILLM